MQAVPLIDAVMAFLIGMGDRRFHERTGYRWFVLHGVTAWIGLEMIRGFIPALGTWAFVGYPLWSQPWLLQPISIVGIYGLDTLIMLSNYVLAQTMFGLFDRYQRSYNPPMVSARATARWGTVLGILLVGRLATIICFDLNFTDSSRNVARQSAQLIAVPSLDGPTIAGIQYTQLVFREIENRVAMVKSDAAWDSAIVDPYGRILNWVSMPEGSTATIIADVPLGTTTTLYSNLGDWPGWLSLAGLVFFAVFMPLRARRAGGRDGQGTFRWPTSLADR